jgi:starch phosphorylase
MRWPIPFPGYRQSVSRGTFTPMTSPQFRPDRSDLEPELDELACNYRWSWHRPTRSVLERVAALAGAAPGAHPVAVVRALTDAQWADLEADDRLIGDLLEAYASLRALQQSTPTERTIAYFSPEFGISEALPQYSGGLGILAGDHLKAASDLGVPLVAVGLFYRQGFFRQRVADGRQQEWYQAQHPSAMGLLDTGVEVDVPLGRVTVSARVWRCDVGAVPLYLLDTYLPGNSHFDRAITDKLYGGDQEHRLRQELVLGIGGARALEALGIAPTKYHLNEGHAGLLVLELIDREITRGATLEQALTAIRPHTLFTTHTPVPAGIDRFPRPLFARYVEPWAYERNIAMDDLYALGDLPGDPADHPFNMAAFCLAAAGEANGVSKLHGAVSREMFGALPLGKAITSVTNGVHARTWVDAQLQDLFDVHLGLTWADGDPDAWAKIDTVPDADLRDLWVTNRRDLADLVTARGATSKLDANVLTIGFARRFATYKRASLLLTDRERLAAILADADRPVQFVFAGKAHPADDAGKALLAEINEFAADRASGGRFVFVPDYDIEVARAMYAGSDVWLNNPVRPMEACGTSGEKAALNGALNCSVRDGWWDEMSDGVNGWDIPTSDAIDPDARDAAEADALYRILEAQIIPLFYDGAKQPPSPAWVSRVKKAWQSLGPQVVAARMVHDYDTRFYRP